MTHAEAMIGRDVQVLPQSLRDCRPGVPHSDHELLGQAFQIIIDLLFDYLPALLLTSLVVELLLPAKHLLPLKFDGLLLKIQHGLLEERLLTLCLDLETTLLFSSGELPLVLLLLLLARGALVILDPILFLESMLPHRTDIENVLWLIHTPIHDLLGK